MRVRGAVICAAAVLAPACAFALEEPVSGTAPVREELPLPEHPRPDWERADWLNLNGRWEFGFEPKKYDRAITVPFGWGSALSGVKDVAPDKGFYRRTVRIPAAWKGRRVFVVVGASDHDTTCTFDGNALGAHSGGYTPFEFELTEFARWGEEQTLEFAVWDPSDETARNGHYLYGKQGYGNARGIWQTVYLEARGDEYVDYVRFTPSIASKSVVCEAFLGAPSKKGGSIFVDVAGQTFKSEVKPGDMVVSVKFPLAEPHLWTLEDPYLYDVAVRFGDDAVKSYFGFREIGVGRNPNGDSYMTLNGKPLYLQMCLDQSYHPDGWYTFPSDEAMKRDILISKSLALTGNRVHIKVEMPRKLYWADRLGILIQADVPCAWGDACEAGFEEHFKCFEGMVKRDFNHPSIYQWTLFNETWGLFSNRSLAVGLASGEGMRRRVYRDSARRRVAEAYRRAKALDPTRLIEDNSPCHGDHVVTDVNTWHAYRPGYEWERTVSQWCENTWPGSPANYVPGYSQRGEPMMNSECGNVWGYKGSSGDCDFTWDYHMMINAFRRHLKCAGWLYTEHHDVTNEWNGYVRFDRTWKESGFEELAGMRLADLHGDAAIFFAGTKGSEIGEIISPDRIVKIPVGVSLITDKYAGKKLSLASSCWWYDAEGFRRERAASAHPGTFTAKSWQCEKLWDISCQAPQGAACGCVVFDLFADGERVARNFWSFSTVSAEGAAQPAPAGCEWSLGSTNVLGGLKWNGFGKGSFSFLLAAPAEGGVFRAELSAKRMNGKDFGAQYVRSGLDDMLGGGTNDRSKNPNSYPQTCEQKFPAKLRVYLNGRLAHEQILPDDPADSRGILSWLAQPRDRRLREAGSYGYLVEVPVRADDVKGGRVEVRLESDRGLAVYGRAFGRYPLDPHVAPPARFDSYRME